MEIFLSHQNTFEKFEHMIHIVFSFPSCDRPKKLAKGYIGGKKDLFQLTGYNSSCGEVRAGT